jgi:sulfhydrogenase subunit beta (sulfur reductase)
VSENKVYYFLTAEGLEQLITVLRDDGYQTLAPVELDGSVLWSEITSVGNLPKGRRDEQQPGSYRISETDTNYFGINHGFQSLKALTFKAKQSLVRFTKDEEGIHFEVSAPQAEKIAVIGARACDVAALQIQQRVFEPSELSDPYFKACREKLLVVAVNCTHAQATCFCASTQTGPQVKDGFDLALTGITSGFLLESGSKAGEQIIQQLQPGLADQSQQQQAADLCQACAGSQSRSLADGPLTDLLTTHREHPHWQAVADRCLSCGNCTMVCPTCFCHTVEEIPDLSGESSERFRIWDSCFNPEHGYIHGKNMRPTTRERYRMWMTHKLTTWHQQFDSSGCVGCGRCITWCPVGIDITEEVAMLMEQKQ